MRKMIILTASLFSLGILFLSADALAYCVPDPKTGFSCIAGDCKNLGDSTLDGDNYNIIACLTTDSGNKWAAISVMPRSLEKVPYADMGANCDPTSPVSYSACTLACSEHCQTVHVPGRAETFSGGFLSVFFPDKAGCSCFY